MPRHALVALLLSLPAPVAAQERPPLAAPAPDAEFETVVVVASRRPERLAQVVAFVSVIDRQDLERRMAQDIADLARYLPGVRVDSDSNRFGRQGFVIRGLGGNRVRVEIDGVPLPDAFAVGQFASAGRDLVDLEAIERVEILRGPASTLYGSDALAGIVAFRSRDPADLLARGEGDSVLGLRGAWAGRDHSRLLAASWAVGSADGWQGMLLAARREGAQGENRAWRGQDAANPADYGRDALLAKLVRDAGAFGRWTLVLDHSRGRQQTEVDSLEFGPGRFATTYELRADDRNRRDRLSLAAEWSAPLPWLDHLELLAYGQDSDIVQESAQFRLADNATPFQSLRWRHFAFSQRERGLDLVGMSERRFAGATHRQVFGVEWERTDYSGLRDGVETNLATGTVSTVILGERYPLRDFPHSRATRFGAFWQDEIEVGRLALLPGLRWERYRLDARPDALFRARYPGLETVDVGATSLTPRLGLRFAASARASLFLQYARGFRAPPFSDVNIGLSLPALNYEVRANPDLRAETSRGLEAGLRWHGPALRGTLSLFDNQYRDLIESRANLGIDPQTGALVFQSVNRDRARIRGLEAEFVLDGGALHRSLSGWSLRGAFAAARGDDGVRKRPLNSIDPARASLGLRYEAPGADWGGELLAVGAWRKTRVDESAGALFAPPGHLILDALAWWQPRPGLRLNLALGNLFDRRYWEWGSVRGVAANAPDLGFYTRPGRHLAASLGVDW